MRVLPPPLCRAIATMRWSFDDAQPLYYESLERMERNRAGKDDHDEKHPPFESLLSLSRGANSKNSRSNNTDGVVQDTLDTLFGPMSTTGTNDDRVQNNHQRDEEHDGDDDDDDDDERKYFGWISLALICLGHGWTDECHNLVTPLSYPDDISFAHGPSRYATAGPIVRTYATYVHSLV